MKIILKEDVHKLGQKGDVVEVKPGFARNYLMPQKLAILFTEQQQKSFEEANKVEERKCLRFKAENRKPKIRLSIISQKLLNNY